jgi:hypothetical protein
MALARGKVFASITEIGASWKAVLNRIFRREAIEFDEQMASG